MNETITPVREATLALPAQAPLVRVTAGLGSAGQKTWNLRRVVTLIGSRRPAHIVLHDRDISGAHCVIVNTGTDVILRDLHSRGGTFCNQDPIEITTLADGDVITIGETKMQVAIQGPADPKEDSGCGLKLEDPLRFPHAVTVQLLHTDHSWEIDQAVVLIGKHGGATIHLDHEEVVPRHAILFRFVDRPAVFDLGGPTGLWVNGQRCSLTPLDDGDCLTVGPFGLSVHYVDPSAGAKPAKPAATAPPVPVPPAPAPAPVDPPQPAPDPEPFGATTMLGEYAAAHHQVGVEVGGGPAIPDLSAPVAPPPDGLENAPPAVDSNISELWDRLNSWQSRLAQNATALSKQESDLAARSAELDARDAALRGELHDLTRLNEKITLREKDLARQAADIQARTDELKTAMKAFADREAEFEKGVAELQRREHAITQRWTRMRSASCAHCGKPLQLGQ